MDAQALFNVNGLVAVITGGGSGLGLYAARVLDANGAAAVYIVGRREGTLKQAAATSKNGKIIPVVGDVSDKSSLLAIADRVRKEQGFVNFLFANAGVSGPRIRDDVPSLAKGEKPSIKELQDGLWKPDMDIFTNTFHINSTAVFYTAVAFLDLLDAGNKKRNVPQDSQILVTSSVAGFSRFLASSVAYSTSKASGKKKDGKNNLLPSKTPNQDPMWYAHGTCLRHLLTPLPICLVNHLVKMLSTLFAQQGYHIRCNLIAPGLYPSEMTEKTMSTLEKHDGIKGHETDFADAHKMPPDRCPAERTGSEQDFAGTVLFMASRAGAYLNGETLISDGGRMAQLPATY